MFALKSLSQENRGLLRLALITLSILTVMGVLIPGRFLSARNFASMSFQLAEIGLVSIAMMLAMISGGIDLSVVGTATLSGILASLFMLSFAPLYPAHPVAVVLIASAIAFVSGAFCGLVNGVLVATLAIPPILATLGTMQLFTGIAVVLTKGSALHGFPEPFLWLGNGYVFGVPVPLAVFALFMALFTFLLGKTAWGFKLYVLGINPTASKFSGIRNASVLIRTYMMSGVLAAAAGLVMYARTNSAKADYGVSYILQAILVAVLGGIDPNGGRGRPVGVLLALLSLQFLSSGFAMLRFSNFSKEFVWGALLLAVMLAGQLESRRGANRAEQAPLS